MTESSSVPPNPAAEATYRRRYCSFFVQMDNIEAGHRRDRVGSRGAYQGIESWTEEERELRKKGLEELDKLARSLGLTPEQRKVIHDSVARR